MLVQELYTHYAQFFKEILKLSPSKHSHFFRELYNPRHDTHFHAEEFSELPQYGDPPQQHYQMSSSSFFLGLEERFQLKDPSNQVGQIFMGFSSSYKALTILFFS